MKKALFYLFFFLILAYVVVINSERVLFYVAPSRGLLVPKPLLIFFPMIVASMTVAILGWGRIRRLKRQVHSAVREVESLKNRVIELQEKEQERLESETTQPIEVVKYREPGMEVLDKPEPVPDGKQSVAKRELTRAIWVVGYFVIALLVFRWSLLGFFGIFVPVSFLVAVYFLLKGTKRRLVAEGKVDRPSLSVIEYFEGPLFLTLFAICVMIVYQIVFMIIFYG